LEMDEITLTINCVRGRPTADSPSVNYKDGWGLHDIQTYYSEREFGFMVEVRWNVFEGVVRIGEPDSCRVNAGGPAGPHGGGLVMRHTEICKTIDVPTLFEEGKRYYDYEIEQENERLTKIFFDAFLSTTPCNDCFFSGLAAKLTASNNWNQSGFDGGHRACTVKDVAITSISGA